MTISRKSRYPLYAQIRQKIEQDMFDNKLVSGDKLPSEDELSGIFNVSRMTVRRAIDQLVLEGKLKRIQGQGTFVIEQAPQIQAGGITRWTFERIDTLKDLNRQVLQVIERTPGLRVANALRTIPGETVIHITGLLSLKDEVLGYYIYQIPKLLVPTIDDWDLGNEALPDFLARCCRLEFGKVIERIRAVPADEEAVEILGVELDSPLLHVDSLIHLKSGIPIIASDTAYHFDSYEYRGLLHPL